MIFLRYDSEPVISKATSVKSLLNDAAGRIEEPPVNGFSLDSVIKSGTIDMETPRTSATTLKKKQ